MADSLLGNINGRYYQQLGVLTGNQNVIKVLVEDELDIPFWNDVLAHTVQNKKFKISPYTYNEEGGINSLTKGKQHILDKAKAGDFNPFFIGCVDSDYDYLLKDYKDEGKTIAQCPYLLQTYTYSIENLMCQAETLHSLCCKTCKESVEFDFENFVKNASRIIYPLLIWALYLETNGREDFTATQWNEIFPCDRGIGTTCTETDILQKLQQNVTLKIEQLQTLYAEEEHEKEEFTRQMMDALPHPFTLNQDNGYLFVRGHDIHHFLLKTVLEPVHKITKNKHLQEIRQSNASPQDKKNRIQQYLHIVSDMEDMLNLNYDYKQCSPVFQWIKQDIQNLYV